MVREVVGSNLISCRHGSVWSAVLVVQVGVLSMGIVGQEGRPGPGGAVPWYSKPRWQLGVDLWSEVRGTSI